MPIKIKRCRNMIPTMNINKFGYLNALCVIYAGHKNALLCLIVAKLFVVLNKNSWDVGLVVCIL